MNRAMAGLAAEDNDIIKVEHVFTLNFSDKWERPMRKIVQSWLDVTYHYAESFRFLAIGISAYFVLLGASKFIEAARSGGKGDSHSKSSGSGSSGSKSSTTSSSSSSKEKARTSKPRSTTSKSDSSHTRTEEDP
jgi:Sec-independent protein translocase protein TatA